MNGFLKLLKIIENSQKWLKFVEQNITLQLHVE